MAATSIIIAQCKISDPGRWSFQQQELHMQFNIKAVYSLKDDVRTLFCLQDQRLSCRRSRCDATFKRNGEPVERQRQNDFKLVCIYIYDRPYDSNPLENSGFTSRVFPWSSTAGLMSYTARRRDTIKYKELSLKCLPGHILGKKPWARILDNMLDLPTGVQTQIPQSLGPSHRD